METICILDVIFYNNLICTGCTEEGASQSETKFVNDSVMWTDKYFRSVMQRWGNDTLANHSAQLGYL